MDECRERGLANRTARPRLDANVEHPAALTPAFVDVAVEQPSALVDWTMLDEPVVIVAVASIREVARQDLAVVIFNVGSFM